MKSIEARRAFMETAPPQIISVEKSPRGSKFETILEESMSMAEECVSLGAANLVATCGEAAPAPVITVAKYTYKSTLDTIWEDTMHYAEYFVSEAADVILGPVLRLNYWESLSNQFCLSSLNLDQVSSSGAPDVHNLYIQRQILSILIWIN